MKISAQQAMAYFQDKSQQLAGFTPDQLTDNGFEYWAEKHICGVFHFGLWPGVWMAHYGVKPEGLGKLDKPAQKILTDFTEANGPALIIGWTAESNKRALAFARRIGFVETGAMNVKTGRVITQEWRPQ